MCLNLSSLLQRTSPHSTLLINVLHSLLAILCSHAPINQLFYKSELDLKPISLNLNTHIHIYTHTYTHALSCISPHLLTPFSSSTYPILSVFLRIPTLLYPILPRRSPHRTATVQPSHSPVSLLPLSHLAFLHPPFLQPPFPPPLLPIIDSGHY